MNSNSVMKKVLSFTCYGNRPISTLDTDPAPLTELDMAIARLQNNSPGVDVNTLILKAVETAGTQAVDARNQERREALRAGKVAKCTDKLERVKGDVYEVLSKLKSGQIYTTAEAKIANLCLKEASAELSVAGRVLRNAFGIKPEKSEATRPSGGPRRSYRQSVSRRFN